MTVQEIRAKKHTLRKKYKTLRAEIEKKSEKSEEICSNILSSMSYKYCRSVLLFYPTNDEPDILAIAKACLKDGRKVFFPKCYDGGIIRFFRIYDLYELVDGRYGIPEPMDDAEEYTPESSAELCLVPGLCFDKRGSRLGYGKGYYDRFLTKFKGISMGIVYSECVESENLPSEKRYDKTVDLIVTEKEVMCIG